MPDLQEKGNKENMTNRFDDMFKEMAGAGMTSDEVLAQFKEAQAAAEKEYAHEAWLEDVKSAENDLIESMAIYIETIFEMEMDDKEYSELKDRVRETTQVMMKLKETNDQIENNKDLDVRDVDKVIKRFVDLLG